MGEDEDTGTGRSAGGDDRAEPAAPTASAGPYGPLLPVNDGPLPQPAPNGPRPLDQRLEAFVTGGAYGVLAVLGLALGLIGSFLYSGTLGPVPVAAITLIAVNLGFLWVSGWAMNSPLGVLVPAAAWSLVVVILSAKRPEGDLVITGTMPGYVFMVGGMVAALIAVVVAMSRSPGSWLLRGVNMDSRIS